MNELADVYAEHLEETLRSADRYLLFAASAALAFVVFSFAKAGDKFEFELAGFPLHMNAVLAQVLFYAFSVGAFWLGDHAVLHCRDLVRKLNKSRACGSDNELSHDYHARPHALVGDNRAFSPAHDWHRRHLILRHIVFRRLMG
jgi:hypothetical protein